MGQYKVCRGKTFDYSFSVSLDEEESVLEEQNLKVEIIEPLGTSFFLPIHIEGDDISFRFEGTQQRQIGEHSVRLWLNHGASGQCMLDIPNAFELVHTTDEEVL